MRFLSVFHKLRERWSVDFSVRGKRRKKPARPSRARRAVHLTVEGLEERTVPATLPQPIVTGQTAIASSTVDGNVHTTNNTPTIVVDPTNSQNLVAVFTTHTVIINPAGESSAIQGAFSTNGGQVWSSFSVSGPRPDPTTFGAANYPWQTDASVAFDRLHNFYVVWSEHRTDNSAGAIRIQKFNFSSGSPSSVNL